MPAAEQRTPPGFAEARNRRQKARSAGLDPDYWYPVEHADRIGRGQVIETSFWGRSIAVYRGQDGVLRALENRCAHRQLKLSVGEVVGDRLVCPYHGWCYAGDGRLASIPHDHFGRELPKIRIGAWPLEVRYGLVWIFPGDPSRARERALPRIPEIEGPRGRRWAFRTIDLSLRAHHSMILENICDFTHGYLHRRYRPFSIDARLTRCETVGDSVRVAYDTDVGRGRITQLFVDRSSTDTSSMELAYDYPYQWSNTGDRIKSWCFLLPIDENHTRAFFLFLFDHFKVPLLPLHFPRPAMDAVLRAATRLHIQPLLRQDAFAVEEEQRGYERHFDEPHAELNPAVHAFQQLSIRKWEEHLASRARRAPGA